MFYGIFLSPDFIDIFLHLLLHSICCSASIQIYFRTNINIGARGQVRGISLPRGWWCHVPVPWHLYLPCL